MATVREWLFPTGTQLTSGESLTIGLTYFCVGLTVAVLHVTDGTAPWVMIASVFLVNSVTPTLAYAAVTASGGSTAAGVFSGWLVSTRFGLFAAAIAPRLWRSKTKRAIAAHASFDPNVALAMREKDDDDARRVFPAAAVDEGILEQVPDRAVDAVRVHLQALGEPTAHDAQGL